jgi:glycosyltransferase involved in cell wall biosynthesis
VTHLRDLAGASDRVDLNYHGIDTRRFPATGERRPPRDGKSAAAPVALLAVGRAIDKKGFDDLLHALALLPKDRHWRLVHIGGGPLLPALEGTARALGLRERIEWRGPQSQAAVLDAYRNADIFVLPCRITADGDRDGLPNVLLEAQSQRLACVSTTISGIPELIEDGRNGILVEPRVPAALADALGRLIANPALRQRLGESGFTRTTSEFSMDASAGRLAERLADCVKVASRVATATR